MKTRVFKKLDSIIGRKTVMLLPAPLYPETASSVTSILIIRPGGIGDAVLLAPAIKSFKSSYSNAHITILAEKRNSAVFSFIPDVDTVLCFDRPYEFFQVLLGKFDVVIDTEQWHRLSAVVTRLIRSPIKIGFDTNERRRMFTHCVRYDPCVYEVDNFPALLKPLGIVCQRDIGSVTMILPLKSLSKAEQLLQPLCSDPFVVIFPGASTEEKRWGADRFRRVAEILSAFGVRIVVVGGKDDLKQGEVIAGGGLGLNLAGLTSLAETAAVIQKSSLLLSGDSGVLHIAAGLGVPTVSLFGPGSVKKWAPRGEHHIVINKGLPCSPCTTFGNTPPCPNNNRCMKDITVDEVVNSVTMMLTSVGAMPSRCCKRDWIETR